MVGYQFSTLKTKSLVFEIIGNFEASFSILRLVPKFIYNLLFFAIIDDLLKYVFIFLFDFVFFSTFLNFSIKNVLEFHKYNFQC